MLYGEKREKGASQTAKVKVDILTKALADARLTVVDVGARGDCMSEVQPFAPFIHYAAVEPDRNAGRQLIKQLQTQASWRRITVVPEALAPRNNRGTLYITKYPGLSSLLLPNRPVIEKFAFTDEFNIESKEEVDMLPLDEAAVKYDFADACLIKLDTQGTELDILKSGELLIRKSILGIFLEISFQEIYEKQPLFSDVDQYLRSGGFQLFRLDRVLSRRANYKPEVYSRREPIWGRAFYLKSRGKNLQDLCNGLSEDDQHLRDKAAKDSMLAVLRLLFLALAFEHFDFAYEIVNSGNSSKLLSGTYGPELANDVDAYIMGCSHNVCKKITRSGNDINKYLSKFHKDNKYRY